MIRTVHEGPAYDPADIARRVAETVDVMVGCGTRLADTMVDVTPDRVGTDALTQIMDIAAVQAARITIRAAAYTPLGFSDRDPAR